MKAQQSSLQARRDDRLHERLAGLIVLAAERYIVLGRQLQQRGNVGSQIGRTVGEGNSQLQRRIGIDHARCDFRARRLQALFEGG